MLDRLDLSISDRNLRELQLEQQMLDAGITGYVRQFKFSKKRKWKSDFFIPIGETGILVEVEGGVYSGGRHLTGSGFTKDVEKYNEAEILGYKVIRVTGEMVNSEDLKALDFISRAIESLHKI